MADNSFVDYYKVLGVSRSASDEEIGAAYKRLMREHHPDRSPGSAKKAADIGQAYEALGSGGRKAKTRHEYDTQYDLWKSGRRVETGIIFGGSGSPLDQMFSDIFGPEMAILFGAPQEKVSNNFKISDNDLGLLAALIDVYRSDKPGKWNVYKSERDGREWMPKRIFSIISHDDGDVVVCRTVMDWRTASARTKDIQLEGKILDAASLFSEHYFDGDAMGQIPGLSSAKGYSRYIYAMKALAERLSGPAKRDGKYDVPELDAITHYTETNKTRIRMEGQGEHPEDKRDIARIIRLEDFWDEIENAGSRVEYKGEINKGKEGQNRSGRERFF